MFGIGNTLVDVSGVTLLQRAVRDEVLGRVFGALQSILVLGLGVGALIAPLLIDLVGIARDADRRRRAAAGPRAPALARRLRDDRRARPHSGRADRAPLRQSDLRSAAASLGRASRDQARAVAVSAGDTVFRQGDHGDRFYIVEDGRCEVSIDGEKVSDAWPGETFGEIALLRDVPRTATVTAVEDTKLLALERDDFIAAVTGHAPSREAADAVIGARLRAPVIGVGISSVTAPLTDAELVARCRAGDERAWAELVERFSRYVYAIAIQGFRLSETDAEDVFQEVFARTYERLDKLRDDSAVRPWIAQLTRNLCIDKLRDGHASNRPTRSTAARTSRSPSSTWP